MADPKLDPARKHGRITPPWQGASFEQGDHYFAGDVNHTYLFSMKNGKKGKVTVAEETFEETGSEGSEPTTTADPGVIDLVAWAKGEIKPQFFEVKAMAQERFPDAEITNKASIFDAMIEDGMITADDLPKKKSKA